MAEYLVMLSHCVIQFREFGFHFPFQPELLIDEVDPFLSYLCPFDLLLLVLLYHQVVPLSLFVEAILGQLKKQVGIVSELRYTKAWVLDKNSYFGP